MSIPAHPYAELFPMLSVSDGASLREDLASSGQRERIILLDGMVLDGRNRQQQLEALGLVDGEVPPEGSDLWLTRYRRFLPAQDGDPLAFVLSLNLHRRHLDDSQRAMVAARIANLGNGQKKSSANLQSTTQPDAADRLHVSTRSVASAREVIEHGAPELIARVDAGEVAVSAAADVAKLPVDEQLRILRESHPREFRAAAKEHRGVVQAEKKERRAEREAELGARQAALPDKRFGVVLADPEWKFVPYSAESGMDRAADNHYPTSTLDVIKSRPVADIAADDCALLLWATVPMLPQALEVMAAWGFAYKSHAVWMKDQIGTGYWFRNQHELLLLGTRGVVPAPAMGDQFRSALAYPLGEHSAKPPFAHEIAEAYWPSLAKIELNARARRPGWDAWGFEAPEAVHAESEAIAMSFEAATPILQAKYATTSGEELSRIIGRPIGTIRTWAHRLELTSAARLAARGAAMVEGFNKEKAVCNRSP
ncbi:MAG TPA: MT-A70 family methyltransferase [Devosia sp.]|jgi:N6-adenosine-specific RNA methylase IME4|nr:MT-A70 family methyltransferase [Devosia sp.]